MDKKQDRTNWLISMFKVFLAETTKERAYEILDIYVSEDTGFTIAQVKLAGRHVVEKNISDIVTDLQFLEGFSKKDIRTLTYLATVEKMKPDYSIVVQHLGSEVDDYILELRSRYGKKVTKKSPSEISKDKALLAKIDPVETNRIGYMAGVKDTVNEFNLKHNISKEPNHEE